MRFGEFCGAFWRRTIIYQYATWNCNGSCCMTWFALKTFLKSFPALFTKLRPLPQFCILTVFSRCYLCKGKTVPCKICDGCVNGVNVSRRVARIFVRGDTTMEGPKVSSEAWRREAPERRGEWGLRRGAVAPRKFSKNER